MVNLPARSLWASAVSTRAAVPGVTGVALVLGSVLLENVGGVYPLFERFRWLSLYHYFDFRGLLDGAAIAPRDALVLSCCLVIGLAGATWSFCRRDLSI
jgi:hypothetical protein